LENNILKLDIEKAHMAGDNNGINSGEMRSATFIAQLATAGFLILGMFGLWWQSADPKARLERIEDIINAERKEFLTNYVSLREHIDLIKRIEENFTVLKAREDTLLSKAEFAAWKIERDKYIDGLVAQIISVQRELTEYKGQIGYTKEAAIAHAVEERQYNEDVRARIDKLYGLYQEVFNAQLQYAARQAPLAQPK
jgi:hypothetical protein